jgi:hypothetical protein
MYRSGRGTAKGKARRWEWAGCSFTPASYSEPCPFRLPRTLEASQRKMHSTVLDLGRSPYPCVCSTATEIPSTTTLEHGTAIDSDFGAMHGQVAIQLEELALESCDATCQLIPDSLPIGIVDVDRLCSGRVVPVRAEDDCHAGNDASLLRQHQVETLESE